MMGRPMPTKATLSDFIMPNVRNRFKGLDEAVIAPRPESKWSHYTSPKRNEERDNLQSMRVNSVKSRKLVIKNCCTELSGSMSGAVIETGKGQVSGDTVIGEFPLLAESFANRQCKNVDGIKKYIAKETERRPVTFKQHATPSRPLALGSAEPSEPALMRSDPKSHDYSIHEDAWEVVDDESADESDFSYTEDWDELIDMGETPDEESSTDETGIFVSVDYASGNINGADEVIELTVALDSGAVDHVLATDHLPSSAEICELTGSRVGKSFVAANGQSMQTFGECTLECLDDKGGRSAASFAVTEVSRPLQSVSRICDQDLEVLFTKTEAKIRDPKSGRYIASYPRRGGLYTRSARVRAGQKPRDPAQRPRAPFTRPGKKP